MPEVALQAYADGYSRAATAYLEVLDPTLAPVHRRLVALAGVAAGSRVLDLATGTGAVARAAAAAGASVVGVDIAPGMVEVARRRSPAGVRFEVADAAALPFGPAAFDAVTCGFGLSHMPSRHEVLTEARRVLRPGGRLAESSWGAEGESPAFTSVLRILDRHSEGRLHAFAGILDEDTWADASRGRQALEAAGFAEVEVHTERLEGTFRDAGSAFDWALAWPDYGETAAALGDAGPAFRAEALDAAGRADLRWWFAINYYVAQAPA